MNLAADAHLPARAFATAKVVHAAVFQRHQGHPSTATTTNGCCCQPGASCVPPPWHPAPRGGVFPSLCQEGMLLVGRCKLAPLLAPRQQPSSPSPLPPFTFIQVLMCKMGTEAAQPAAPTSRAAQAW